MTSTCVSSLICFSDLNLAGLQLKGEHLLIVPLIDKLKREAHKEAWYGKSSNPFRRLWADRRADITEDIEGQSGPQVLRTISSEQPQGNRPPDNGAPWWSSHNDTISHSALVPGTASNSVNDENPEMSGALAHEQSSEDTVVEPQPITSPPRTEQSVLQRFMAIFRCGYKADISDKVGVIAVTSVSPTPQKSPNRQRFTLGSQLKATIFNSWINLLLIAAPVGIATHFINVSPVAVFIVNFIAIIPLAAMLSYATEEIALRVGETLGGLLNATFGFVYTAISTESY